MRRAPTPNAPVSDAPAAATPLLEAAVRHARDGVLITTADLGPPGPTVVFVNAAMEALTGYAAAELLGQSPRVLQGPGTDRAVLDALRAALARGDAFSGEATNYRKDGTPYEVRWDVAPIRDGAGPVTHWVSVQRDVTEERRVAEALRSSEERLRLALDSVDDGVWDWDIVTGANYVSPRWFTMLGYAPGEMPAHVSTWEALVHPDDRPRADAALAAHLAGQTSQYALEYRLRTRAGRWCWVYTRGRVVTRDPDGRPRRMVGTHTEVTAERTAGAALRESEERFRTLSAASPVGIFDVDLAGNILYANPRGLAIWQSTEAAALGHGWTTHVHPADLPALVTGLLAASAEGLEFERQFRLALPDGTRRWVHARSAPRHDDAGRVVGGVGTVEDVTARVTAEDTLARQALAFATISEGVIFTDAQGRITEWNPGAERLFGYRRDEAIGRPADFVWPPETTAALGLPNILADLARGISWRRELEVQPGGGGPRRTVEVVMNPLTDTAGALVGTVGVSRDVTERRMLEDQIRQAQRLEAVGQFASVIAHDFNNVLAVIRAGTELAAAELDPAHPAAADLAEVLTAASRATALAKRLLAFGRQQVPHPRRMALNDVVEEALPLVRRLVGPGVTVDARLGDGVAPIEADPMQLEQVLLNLAANARDAMRGAPERRFVLTTRDVTVDDDDASRPGLPPGPYTLLLVRDTGHGMDAATRARAFEPFFTTKPAGEGTGLGLASVYGIMAQLGGSVYLDSAPGAGAAFALYFPTAAPARR